jgi:hypothetical protein
MRPVSNIKNWLTIRVRHRFDQPRPRPETIRADALRDPDRKSEQLSFG